ncbi:hypothetical protein Tco_0410168 [Tanacetum coccineum]
MVAVVEAVVERVMMAAAVSGGDKVGQRRRCGDVVDVDLVWMVGRGWWSGWQRLWPEMPKTTPETHQKKREEMEGG